MLNTELEVINTILRKLGEPPVSSVDVQYPTLDLVRPALREARQSLLIEGWWFNTFEDVVLTPQPDGRIVVPGDTLMFYPDSPEQYTYTGQAICRANGDPFVGANVTGRRVVDQDFFTLPTSARYTVTYFAAAQVYAQDIGVDDVYQDLVRLYMASYQELSAQHTRSRKHNTRRKLQVARWRSLLRT